MNQYDAKFVQTFTNQEAEVDQVIVLMEDITREALTGATVNHKLAQVAKSTSEHLVLLKAIVDELRRRKAEDQGV